MIDKRREALMLLSQGSNLVKDAAVKRVGDVSLITVVRQIAVHRPFSHREDPLRSPERGLTERVTQRGIVPPKMM